MPKVAKLRRQETGLLSRICRAEGCTTRASFGNTGDTRASFCKKHAEPEMINITAKRCQAYGCFKQPNFGNECDSRPSFCKAHADVVMIDVCNKKCQALGCYKRPSFGNKCDFRPLFCKSHAGPWMIDIRSKRCQAAGCLKIPCFGNVGNAKRSFCKAHASAEMIDIKSKRCRAPGCSTRPIFGHECDDRASFCKAHVKPGMIDIINKRCEADGCVTEARYGIPGFAKSHCATHATKGRMVPHPRKRCAASSCTQLGTSEFGTQRWCALHAPDGARNIALAPCATCGLEDLLINNTCGTCDPDLIKRVRHIKEEKVAQALRIDGLDVLARDVMLEGSDCVRARPDFQLLGTHGAHWVYVECDENQHDTYERSCEVARMWNLAHVRGMPVTFIRFNPDSFVSDACVSGIPLARRLDELIKWTRWAIDTPPCAPVDFNPMNIPVRVLWLFYDGYEPGKVVAEMLRPVIASGS